MNFEQEISKKNVLLLLCLSVAGLVVFGTLILFSATFQDAAWPRFRSHLHWLYLGLVLALMLARVDYAWLDRPWVSYVLGGLCLLLLLAVFVPGVGVKTNGAHRWLRGLGQPSEFAKPAVVVLLAIWCARRTPMEMNEPLRGFLYPALMGFAPAFLVFLQPDWGTCALLSSVTLVMLVVAGARWSHVGTAVGFLALGFVILVVQNPVRLLRITVFLDPEAHRFGAGWQVWQSLLAIGSGGWYGRFLEGSLHKYGFVPEQQTDFIFARIGEETGLWGASLVVMLFVVVLVCGLWITRQARDRFGQLLAFGCAMAIVLQALFNIAVATGLVPNKGLPLPFVSYGGSNMLAMCICLALLINVGCRINENRE